MELGITPFLAKKIIKIIKKNSGLTNTDVEYVDDLSDEIAIKMLTKLIKLQLLS